MIIYWDGKIKTKHLLLKCTNKKLRRLLLQYWHKTTLTSDSSSLAKIAQDMVRAVSSFSHILAKLLLIPKLSSSNPTLYQARRHHRWSHFKSNTSTLGAQLLLLTIQTSWARMCSAAEQARSGGHSRIQQKSRADNTAGNKASTTCLWIQYTGLKKQRTLWIRMHFFDFVNNLQR